MVNSSRTTNCLSESDISTISGLRFVKVMVSPQVNFLPVPGCCKKTHCWVHVLSWLLSSIDKSNRALLVCIVYTDLAVAHEPYCWSRFPPPLPWSITCPTGCFPSPFSYWGLEVLPRPAWPTETTAQVFCLINRILSYDKSNPQVFWGVFLGFFFGQLEILHWTHLSISNVHCIVAHRQAYSLYYR